jgi:tRNA A-37 threonylcarbamoyl transferase component Bud32
VDFGYAMAHDDFYAPLCQVSEAGHRFMPSAVPTDWSASRYDVWTLWRAPGTVTSKQGWKVHVSARLDRADSVLDQVAEACFAERVSFKHISAELFFLFLHHKHGPRAQSGKFCAAYPPDEQTARQLMDRLAHALAEEEGPYVLTDRRYRTSRTVHYRYGAHQRRVRLRPDGTRDWLVRDGTGRDTTDRRGPSFALPDGIVDPFAEDESTPRKGPVVLHGYEIVRAIQPSNAGGTYEGRDRRTGRTVFVKEARAHNGLYWDRSTAQDRLRREHQVLRALHKSAPGVCPEPLAYFREWEHEFLVTEFVDGKPLNQWAASRAPILFARQTAADFAAYYAICTRILDNVKDGLDRIHALGYRFGDIHPRNILVTDDGRARLVDFEAASHRNDPVVSMGADGYVLPDHLPSTGPFTQDEYGLAAIALALLFPIHHVVVRSPGNLHLLRHDLERHAPVPAALWRRATRFYLNEDTTPPPRLPSPRQQDTRPRESLQHFADEVGRGVLALADPSHPERMFPTTPRGFTTNTLCVAHGTAGVLHALHLAGAEIPADVLARFRRDATTAHTDLPPGLHIGSAGVGWVLAELGLLEEAMHLVFAANQHPLTARSTTLGEGRAGVGLACLALHHRTGDQRWLDRAVAAGEMILGARELASTLGEHDAVGLLHGRTGLALFLYYLARDTAEPRFLAAGHQLLHHELERAITLPDGTLSFSDGTRRAMAYLSTGSAGVVTVATRYLATAPDDTLAAALPRMLGDITKTCTVQPGLCGGLAGLAFALAEHADWAGTESHRAAAVQVASGLIKHAIPDHAGVRFLGDGSRRYSADLWSGSAGVLLAVHRVLHGPADQFFTLDRPPLAPAVHWPDPLQTRRGGEHHG